MTEEFEEEKKQAANEITCKMVGHDTDKYPPMALALCCRCNSLLYNGEVYEPAG